MMIEVTDEMLEDVRLARCYEGDESFVNHCGWDLIEAVEAAQKGE